MSVFCTELARLYVGLVVDRVITCSLQNVESIEGKTVVIIEQSSGLICEIRPYDCNVNDPSLTLICFPEGSTLMPGFIDSHVHLTIATDDYQLDHLRLSSADKTLRALKAAQGLLQAGFTTLRTAGDADIFYPTFALARAITRGDFDGPRIVGAGHYISVTAGGGDINFLAPDSCSCCATDGLIADGKDEMIKAVRKEIKFGSDWIKILATGAFMSASTNLKDSPENTHFSKEELEAVVEGNCLYIFQSLVLYSIYN